MVDGIRALLDVGDADGAFGSDWSRSILPLAQNIFTCFVSCNALLDQNLRLLESYLHSNSRLRDTGTYLLMQLCSSPWKKEMQKHRCVKKMQSGQPMLSLLCLECRAINPQMRLKGGGELTKRPIRNLPFLFRAFLHLC